MENASKALIIAGAILLSILLISLGIMIFNQAQDTVTNSGMTEAELTSFNNKFLKYEGDQKGSMVKSMIQDVKSSNANASDGHKVTVILTGVNDKTGVSNADTDNLQSTSVIDSKHTYNVKMGYTNNRVSTITVTYLK